MDNETNNIINQPLINPNPVPAPEIKASPLTRITNWINTHRKLTLAIIAGIFLIIILIFTFFPTIKDRLFNKSAQTGPATNSPKIDTQGLGSIILTSPKTTYALNEKIPVSVKGDTFEKAITAFDVAIEYDQAFLTLGPRKDPPIQDFQYYGNSGNGTISISAVQKPESQTAQIFKDTNLFDLEFTPKKSGRTTIKMIYSPDSTSDSNLLDGTNKDILSTVRGIELSIE